MKSFVRYVLTAIVAHAELAAQSSTLEQRLTDLIDRAGFMRPVSASRYVPVFLGRGLATWASPPKVLSIDGIPFGAYPLNLVSPDYAPVDLIIAGSVESSPHPVIDESGVYPAGQVAFKRAVVPDTFHVAARVFGGSETGDVILQEYTRDNLPFYNRNKIGFSGALTVSDRLGGFAYRLMAGGFSYFSTGYADRDRILIPYIDLPTFSQPNRHYLGSLEFEFDRGVGRPVTVRGSANAFEAWEQIPFLSTFSLISGAAGSFGIDVPGLVPLTDLRAWKEIVEMDMRGQVGTLPGRYRADVSVLNPIVRIAFDKDWGMTVPAEIAFHRVGVPENGTQLFVHDLSRTTWAIGLKLHGSVDGWKVSGHGRTEKGLSGSMLVSGDAAIEAELTPEEQVSLRLTSVASSPSLLETHGIFATWRYRPVIAQYDTLRITGTPSLRPSRTSGVDLSYCRTGTIVLRTSVFAYVLENPVGRKTLSVIRSAFPGDLVFSGKYDNFARRHVVGGDMQWEVRFSNGAHVGGEYAFTHHPQGEIPRHQVRIQSAISPAEYTALELIVRGTGKTRWPEFAFASVQDDLNSAGSDGVTSEFWTVDCRLVQHLGPVLGMRDLSVSIELQNLLNRRFKTSPIGVTKDFAVIGFISARF